MTLQNLTKTAIISLSKNKLRSALTSIGVIIGVSSVIIMIGIGNSARQAVKNKISTYGANTISVSSMFKNFSEKDITDLATIFPQINYISPVDSQKNIVIKYFNRNTSTRVFGVNNDYFKMKNWKLARGRFFTDYEITHIDKVAILGYNISKKLFDNPADSINSIILIENVPYRVIGTIIEMGSALSGTDFDNVAIIPYTTFTIKVSGKKEFYEIYVSTEIESAVDPLANMLRNHFAASHDIINGKSGFIKVTTSKEQLQMAEYISNALSALLAGIASISLIVGGIGIMNIMLVSVTERTREIGIRMAIGAKGSDIQLQFLIESIILSTTGGSVGIILGIIIYFSIVYFIKWPFIFSIVAIFMAFFVATLTGVLAGYYPAKKAASLNPIDALRTE